VKDILSHAWFKTIKQEDILEKKVVPNYKPEIKDKDDTSHFDE